MTEHALILCREPGRHSTLVKGHEEGGSAYANAGSSLRSPPGCSRASPPPKKPESICVGGKVGTYPAKGVGQGVVCSEKAFFF